MGSQAATTEVERELVVRAQSGDGAAFESLVELHRDRVLGLASRIVRSPSDAEEVAQDAFVRAWLALPGFRGEARFSTWLHRIVYRLAVDRAARLSRRRGREVGMESMPEPAGPRTEDPSRGSGELEALMERLSEVQRAAITLYYYEDRSVDEIARVLVLPTGTVKTHLSRARAALREAWLRRERSGR